MVHGPINLVGHTGAVYATVFTPDGRRLVSGSGDTTIKIWDVERATEEATLDAGVMGVFSLAITRDGLLLAAAGFADRTVKLWSLASLTELRTFYGHTEVLTSVALSGDGAVLASASQYETDARLWDPHAGTAVRLGHPFGIRCLALTPDGKVLVTSCGEKFIGSSPTSYLTFWDVPTRERIGAVYGEVFRESLAFTADGRRLAVGVMEGDFDSSPPNVRGMVEIWDVASQRREVCWQAHAYDPVALSFTGDAYRLATGSLDTRVKLWGVADQRLEAEFCDQQHPVWDVAISEDGRWLASGGGQTNTAELHLWDLAGK
jgi:WD40 repeat protein